MLNGYMMRPHAFLMRGFEQVYRNGKSKALKEPCTKKPWSHNSFNNLGAAFSLYYVFDILIFLCTKLITVVSLKSPLAF
jgi:hypothetical protein